MLQLRPVTLSHTAAWLSGKSSMTVLSNAASPDIGEQSQSPRYAYIAYVTIRGAYASVRSSPSSHTGQPLSRKCKGIAV
jgi:hypothetical protein